VLRGGIDERAVEVPEDRAWSGISQTDYLSNRRQFAPERSRAAARPIARVTESLYCAGRVQTAHRKSMLQ
jgi:hypothetical protein